MGIDVDTLRGRRATERRNRASIGDIWERQTWSAPDALAIVAESGAVEDEALRRLTYAEADTLANQVAHALADSGLRDGDVAVLVCGNSVEAMLTKIGMAKAGVVVAPLNPALADDVVADVVGHIGARAAVVDAEYLSRIEAILDQRDVPVIAAIATSGQPSESIPCFTDYVSGMPGTEPDTTIHGDDIWQLLFTSGTSAAPKGAMISHHNTHYTALAWAGTLALGVPHERDAVFCSFLPVVFHTADNLAYATWLAGGTVVIGREPDAAGLAEAIGEHGVTFLWAGMPQMVQALVDALRADTSRDASTLASLTYGWAPLEESVYDGLQEVVGHPLRVQSIIGMTEVVVAHRFWLDEHEDLFRRTTPRDNYVGLPHPLLAARLVDDETGETVPREEGRTGEAVYRSPALTGGYYRRREETETAMAGGWFHTGDLFGYGEDGQRLMVDRLKDVVKTGGENVSSIRVEAVLREHPAVATVAVVALPHPRWGEAVTAAVVPAEDTEPSEEDLVAHCRDRLARYEVPKAIVLVDALPTSVGGKLQKHGVRQQLVARDLFAEKDT